MQFFSCLSLTGWTNHGATHIRSKIMAIIRWSPLRELEEMRRNLDKLFGEYGEPVARQNLISKGAPASLVPSIDIFERKGEIVMRTDLPGIEKEQIDLSITKDTLTLKAEANKEEDIRQEDYYVQERSYGTYIRTVQLPQDVDSAKAQASFKNGVLEIIFPKKEEAKVGEIKVDIS